MKIVEQCWTAVQLWGCGTGGCRGHLQVDRGLTNGGRPPVGPSAGGSACLRHRPPVGPPAGVRCAAVGWGALLSGGMHACKVHAVGTGGGSRGRLPTADSEASCTAGITPQHTHLGVGAGTDDRDRIRRTAGAAGAARRDRVSGRAASQAG